MRISWQRMGKIEIWIAILIVGWVGYSCEEYQEGCMDAAATNYRASNQIPCCCEYPNIVFQTTLTSDGSTSAFTDTFVNEMGQRFLIGDLRFMASDITLSDSLDRVFTPVDTFGSYETAPDLMAVDVLNLNSTGGNFMANGRFDRMNFNIGIPGQLETKVPRDFPLEHPLRDSAFYDFTDHEWHVFLASVEVVGQGVIPVQLTKNEWPVPVVIEGDWEKRRGGDLTVNFKVNVDKLFGNLDFTQPLETLRQEVSQNLPDSFEP